MKSINKFTNKFFEKPKHSSIAGAYLESLFQTEGRFSLESVSDQNNEFSYEQIHHFISDSEVWDENKLNDERLRFLNNHQFTQTQADGILVIDDTQAIKNGEATEGVYYQHCGSTGRQENCISFVTSHYTDEHKSFPHKASTYYPHEETKIDLACQLIDDFFTANLAAAFVTFDCWYFTKQIVRKVESQDKLFVSKPKLNRVIFHQGRRLDARSLVTASSTSGACFDEKVTLKDLGKYRRAKTTHIFYRIYQGTIFKLSDLCKVIRNLNIYKKTKMKINDLLASLKLKPNLQV